MIIQTHNNNKKKVNRSITYNRYKHIIGEHKRIRGLGIEMIPHRDILKITMGAIIVGIGIITLPLPTGSLIMIPLGLMIAVSGGADVGSAIRRYQRILRYKLRGLRKC